MAINKRPEDFTLEDIKQLIRDNRELRLENSILKARTHPETGKVVDSLQMKKTILYP